MRSRRLPASSDFLVSEDPVGGTFNMFLLRPVSRGDHDDTPSLTHKPEPSVTNKLPSLFQFINPLEANNFCSMMMLSDKVAFFVAGSTTKTSLVLQRLVTRKSAASSAPRSIIRHCYTNEGHGHYSKGGAKGGGGGGQGGGGKGGGGKGGKGGAGRGQGQGNAGGWPSTSGNPSGGGRSNNSSK